MLSLDRLVSDELHVSGTQHGVSALPQTWGPGLDVEGQASGGTVSAWREPLRPASGVLSPSGGLTPLAERGAGPSL